VIAKHKITSLLVEGGADIFTQFLEKDLFDDIIILQSPKILGRGVKSSNIKKMKNLKLITVEKLGSDIKMVYGKKLSD
jgi:diaminohydroxyphosphoribosylaminopyrimidine deaminase/5-amino-6-(5-phosphoribosylamino)uracil reductase